MNTQETILEINARFRKKSNKSRRNILAQRVRPVIMDQLKQQAGDDPVAQAAIGGRATTLAKAFAKEAFSNGGNLELSEFLAR